MEIESRAVGAEDSRVGQGRLGGRSPTTQLQRWWGCAGLRELDPPYCLARREFLVSLLRSGAVAGVTGAAAVLALRRARLPAAACRRRTACCVCPEWAGCTLPPAVAAKASNVGQARQASAGPPILGLVGRRPPERPCPTLPLTDGRQERES
jgi:hypothetical protein